VQLLKPLNALRHGFDLVHVERDGTVDRAEPIHLKLPGVPPPQNARSACEFLRPRYTQAIILILAARTRGAFQNVRTVVSFGSSRLRPGPDREVRILAAHPCPAYILIRRLVSAATVDAYIADAIAGVASPPNSSCRIGYRLESWWEGLLPRGAANGETSPSGTLSVWRRRRQPTTPSMFGKDLSRANVAYLLDRVPHLDDDDADWALLDVHGDVAAFQALDEYYPIPVRIDASHRSNFIEATVEDPQGWLPQFGGGTLRIEGFRFGLRQTSTSLPVPSANIYQISICEPTTQMVLEVNGVVLDGVDGGFIGVSDTAPPVTGGLLPNVFELTAIANSWRKRDRDRADVIVDPRKDGGDGKAYGHEIIRTHVSRFVGTERAVIDLLDSWFVPKDMLLAVAGALPYGSTLRVVCNSPLVDAEFASVESATGVRIERYHVAIVTLHDRFLRIGDRLWSLGTSLNQLGEALAVILEIRDPVVVGELLEIIATVRSTKCVAHS
jgi:hypothetical protein